MALDFNRIFGTLYMGSAPDPSFNYKSLGFSTIVLCAREHQPDSSLFTKGLELVRAPLGDDGATLPEDDAAAAASAARIVAAKVSKGERVLVTCRAGLNRSGLVCALALHLMTGRPGWYCVETVQSKRHPPVGRALCNDGFALELRRIKQCEPRIPMQVSIG